MLEENSDYDFDEELFSDEVAEESDSNSDSNDIEKSNDGFAESEFEEFAEYLKAIEEFNSHRIDFAKREYDSSKASIFLDHELVDIEAVKSEVKSFIQYRRESLDKIRQYSQGSAKAWQIQMDIGKKGGALRRKLSLLSVGLTMGDIVDVADDYNHLIDDSININGRSLRKKLMQLNPGNRERFLRQMVENGKIDEDEYNRIKVELL